MILTLSSHGQRDGKLSVHNLKDNAKLKKRYFNGDTKSRGED